MSKRRALILGRSLGSLFAAHLLRGVGWGVVVFEQEGGDLAGLGAGTHDGLQKVMTRIGVPIEHTIGIMTCCYTCLDKAGRVFREVALQRTMSAWAYLRRSQFKRWQRTSKLRTAASAVAVSLTRMRCRCPRPGRRHSVREDRRPRWKTRYTMGERTGKSRP